MCEGYVSCKARTMDELGEFGKEIVYFIVVAMSCEDVIEVASKLKEVKIHRLSC